MYFFFKISLKLLYEQYIIIYYYYINNVFLTKPLENYNWDLISYNKIYIIFTIVILCSSLGVIFSKNPVHSVFFLILVFLHVGFFLLLLNVEFLAFLLFIVYLGAIAVLFLFVIMMFNIHILEARDNIIRYIPLVILIFFIIIEMNYINITELIKWKINKFSFMELNYGHKNWFQILFSSDNIFIFSIIYNYYLYHFILASLILLVAMIGAIILTLNQNLNLKKQTYYKQNMKTVYNSLLLKSNVNNKYDIWELYLKKRKWKEKTYKMIGKPRKKYY